MDKTFFETIKAIDGKIYNIKYHQKRYESVVKEFGIDDIQDLNSFLNPPEYGLYRCRLVYDISVSPIHIDVEYVEYKKRDITRFKVLFENDINYSKKSTCRDKIDKLYSLRDDADEILIVKNLLVSDTSIANIAFYENGIWFTPKLPLLNGTTRQRLLDEGKIIEADIKIQDIKKYSKIALMNAMIDFDVLEHHEFLI